MTDKTIIDLELEIAALKNKIKRFEEYGSGMTMALAVCSAAIVNAMVVLETGTRNAKQLLPPRDTDLFKDD